MTLWRWLVLFAMLGFLAWLVTAWVGIAMVSG